MIKSKKGLSGIVTTLIIILLVFVAVGVIWGVVNNLLSRSTGTIQTSTACLDVDIRATKVVSAGTEGDYNVTLARKPTGEGEFGAKLIFYNANGNSEPLYFGEMLSPLETRVMTITNTDVVNATKVSVTPYFNDESGREILCPSSTEFQFR